jgi:hypothetical protein
VADDQHDEGQPHDDQGADHFAAFDHASDHDSTDHAGLDDHANDEAHAFDANASGDWQAGGDHADAGLPADPDEPYGEFSSVDGDLEFGQSGEPGFDADLAAEPSWWSQPLDADLAPESLFTDPFPEDGPLPVPSDGMPWSDTDSLSESFLPGDVLPVAALSVELSDDQLEAPTPAEQAVLDWMASLS